MTKDEINELEIKYISLFKTNDRDIGYNLTVGGDGNKSALIDEYKLIDVYEKTGSVSMTATIMGIRYPTAYKYLRKNNITPDGKNRGKSCILVNVFDDTITRFSMTKDASEWIVSEGYSDANPENIAIELSKFTNNNRLFLKTFFVFSYYKGGSKCI